MLRLCLQRFVGKVIIARIFTIIIRLVRRIFFLFRFIWSFQKATSSSGDLNLFWRLISTKLLDSFLSFPLNIFYLVFFYFLKVLSVCFFIIFDLKSIVFWDARCNHRLWLLHGKENSFFVILLIVLFFF